MTRPLLATLAIAPAYAGESAAAIVLIDPKPVFRVPWLYAGELEAVGKAVKDQIEARLPDNSLRLEDPAIIADATKIGAAGIAILAEQLGFTPQPVRVVGERGISDDEEVIRLADLIGAVKTNLTAERCVIPLQLKERDRALKGAKAIAADIEDPVTRALALGLWWCMRGVGSLKPIGSEPSEMEATLAREEEQRREMEGLRGWQI